MRRPRPQPPPRPGATPANARFESHQSTAKAFIPRSLEPLWSPVVATGGNQRQIAAAHKPRKQAKSVATGCHRLPATFHGKEGVDGSSPSEGSAIARRRRFPVQLDLLLRERAVGTEPSMVLGLQNRVARRALE